MQKHQKQHQPLEEPLFDSNFTICLYRIMLESGKRYKKWKFWVENFFCPGKKTLFFFFYALILKIIKQTGLLGYAISFE